VGIEVGVGVGVVGGGIGFVCHRTAAAAEIRVKLKVAANI